MSERARASARARHNSRRVFGSNDARTAQARSGLVSSSTARPRRTCALSSRRASTHTAAAPPVSASEPESTSAARPAFPKSPKPAASLSLSCKRANKTKGAHTQNLSAQVLRRRAQAHRFRRVARPAHDQGRRLDRRELRDREPAPARHHHLHQPHAHATDQRRCARDRTGRARAPTPRRNLTPGPLPRARGSRFDEHK